MTAVFRDSPEIHYPSTCKVTATSSADGSDLVRTLAQEVPVALVFNGTTAAVMMASPSDIEDFAIGFAMTEEFISAPDDIEDYEQVAHKAGIEARFWLRADASDKVAARRRAMAGPVGCGLCGIDSLEQALRSVRAVPSSALRLDADEAAQAPELLRDHQHLHDRTRSAHAAGFLVPGQGIIMAREDVGRHNALDKLLGALIRSGIDPSTGAVVMTSRVSLELVQKTAVLECSVLIAASSPTALAVDIAERAGVTLLANAKGRDCAVFTHPYRVPQSS